jgi:hypothetical protein
LLLKSGRSRKKRTFRLLPQREKSRSSTGLFSSEALGPFHLTVSGAYIKPSYRK